MKLTKFQHACFVVEKGNTSVVVDPGAFTHDFIMPKHVSAVFITHNHPDHLDSQLVITILREHPQAVLLADESILQDFKNEHTQAISVGEAVDAGGISLQFVGGNHEPIDTSVPTPVNIGIIIEGHLYYPGDSYFAPSQQIKELLLPVSAPWLTIGRAMDLVRTLKPSAVFPTHDAILSAEGQTLIDTMVTNISKDLNVTYQRINGKTIEL
ncbi:MAG: putative Zn-dependent hydrolase [Candidatus Saccharibacteria bacterium]|nr:putative Zn-dependent hydrolase [Candidatus Saccharibacteria bacterium]